MPAKPSTAEKIISLLEKKSVSVFLDGSPDSDSAKIGTPYTYYEKDKILTIFLVNLKGSTAAKVLPVLKQKWEETGLLLKRTKNETLETYLEYKESNADSGILDFFSDKIPEADVTVLKMSLFLQSEKAKGRNINSYKQEIRERFGERGTYIANLCTSGYFESVFRPYYNSNPEHFEDYYELIVGRELLAIFVHSGMNRAFLHDVLERKIINARRFNIEFFYIHGFGSWNVELINNFIEDYHPDDRALKEVEFNLESNETNPPSIIYQVQILPLES